MLRICQNSEADTDNRVLTKDTVYFRNMENIKITDGQWHVKVGKRWHMRSNFVFSILYEVAHPQDSIYVVDVTTDNGQKGPTQILDLATGSLIHPMDCSLIWLRGDLCQLKGPKLDLAHLIQVPTGLEALHEFLGRAEDILHENIGPAILSWASMYGLNLYTKWMEELRHFNLPVLYGPPTAGKTLIAQCAAWLNGCSELHIASRCTLAFVTSWLTSSSLPFVWDDPTSTDEVSQLAIDLGNGAVRGKANDETRKPLTGCLVTANFDLSAAYKYFSRLFVMKIEKTKHQKNTGDARVLEDAARDASSALPVVLCSLNSVRAADVNKEVANLRSLLKMDIRILEGIALPMVLARMLLNAAQRYDLMKTVLSYIKEVLIPYYQESLMPTCAEVTRAETMTLGDSAFSTILEVCNSQHEDQVATIVTNSHVAVRADQVKQKTVREEVVKLGGKTNHSVRLNGKPKKCLFLPKRVMSTEQWKTVAAAILREALTTPDDATEEMELTTPTGLKTSAASKDPSSLREETIDEPSAFAPSGLPALQAEEQMELNILESATPCGTETLWSLACAPKSSPALTNPPALHTDDEMEVSSPTVPDTPAALPTPSSVEATEEQDNTPPVPTTCDAVPTCKPSPQLPFPVRKSQSETETCFKCKKVGSKYLHWIGCDSCGKWFHRKCTSMTNKEYFQLKEDSVWHCAACKPDS
ncbi:uncharacterized protein LOC133198484 [Saccostrea echinata]|uniref:uncharacterized protein LOC133198484 n=1 Tax=Saccostrea echinata TaxID=191078 RepID=UPI002A828EED|nr:uncharacterized protein LOC133198484 [Saccostrea echinata]